MAVESTDSRHPEGRSAVVHRADEYDPNAFAVIKEMQKRHFWYRGRERFLLRSVHRHLAGAAAPRMIDLGGGCGGWIAHLAARKRFEAAELALADSSPEALRLAADVLPAGTETFQVDLLNLPWSNRWDVAFLLDVLEHIPDHKEALKQIKGSLAPGGLLFITTPALRFFWSWNDELVHHVRRYSKADYTQLAAACGFQLKETRYFMFFLSPLMLAARLAGRPDLKAISAQERQALLERTHRVPSPPVNGALSLIFACETPLGHYLPFPWGTSVLAVLQKPHDP